MIDRLVHISGISNDDQNALFGIKENLERIVIAQKKTRSKAKDIRDYFQCILQAGHDLHVQKYLLLVLKILSCVFRIKLVFQVFVSFASMSYNPDAGIKDHHLSLKLRTLKVPLLRPQKVINIRLSKSGHFQLADKNHFPDGFR